MNKSHCESSPGTCHECRTVPDGCRSLDQAVRLGPLARQYTARKPHPPCSTQPKSWYSFYHPTEGRRLSSLRQLIPDYLAACKQSLIKVVTGPVSINYNDRSQRANHYRAPPPLHHTTLGNISYLIIIIIIYYSTFSQSPMHPDSVYTAYSAI